MEKIELFLIPFARKTTFNGVLPSIVESYSAQVETHEVAHNNLIFLLLRQPWRSSRHILCIHWSSMLYGSKYIPKSIILFIGNFFALTVLKFLYKFKVVWIIHNNYAHDYPHPRIDMFGRWLLRLYADVLVAQQDKTMRQILMTYPRKRVICIPHCNYLSAPYASLKENKSQMRKRFGFAQNDIILLLLGAVRPYKRAECFIQALRTLGSFRDSRLQLWVVGRPDLQYLNALTEHAKDLTCVRFDCEFVPDNDLPAYAACADYAVFYFDESSLTSGGVMLSLSLGLPVIARDIAGTEIIRTGENGYIFKDFSGLLEILKALPSMSLPSRESVLMSLHGTDFAEVERKYFELYDSLV
ncbi:MAG: glycosyltransferase [bacterium]